MAKDKLIFSKSLLTSIALHMICLGAVLSTMSFSDKQPPITVNLQVNPKDDPKIVKAALVDKKSIDAAIARQAEAAAAELKRQQQIQEQLLAEERREEQLKQEAIVAKVALEKAQAQKLKIEAAAKEAALQKTKLEQQKAQQAQAKKLQEKKDQEKLQIAKKAAAEQAMKAQADKAKQAEAAAIKATRDRIAKEHQEFLLNEIDKYRATFQELIEDNRILSTVFTGDISCKIRIKLLPDGSIANVEIVERSGNSAYDEMSAAAVYKSAPFPMPQDQELYSQLRDIILSFKNGEQTADVF